MAALETKTIQVKNDPETINSANNIMSCFGWTVLNVQVTHSQNTKTYTSAFDYYLRGNQTMTVETITINYATITYQRSRGLANYAEIVSLEQEYSRLINEIQEIGEADTKKVGFTLGKLLFALIFPPYWLYIIFSGKNKKDFNELGTSLDNSDKKIAQLNSKCLRILDDAAALVD